MTQALQFGRRMRTKTSFQLGPPPAAPAPPPAPKPITPPPQQPDNNGGMFGPAGYLGTLDRWYNPWTKQQVTNPEEQALMRVGQGALGLGAAAGVGAAGIAAGAPALGSTALSQLPAYLSGNAAASTAVAGGAGAAAANPSATQRMLPTLSGTVNNATQFGSQMSQRVSALGNNAWNKIPQPAQKAITGYRDYVHKPMEDASNAMGGDIIGSPTNTVTKLTRDPLAFIPDSVSRPFDSAKSLSKTLNPTRAGVAY